MYGDQPLQQFLDELASSQPTPGGGSACALTGAMAAALASMVARLTLDRADYAPVHAEIAQLLQQSERYREQFQQLLLEDIEVYGRLSAAYKLPRNTADEKEARSQTIQAALLDAALAPLSMVESAALLVQDCHSIAQIGNKNLLSDIATSAILAASAARGAAAMVRVNLRSMKDQHRVNTLSDILDSSLASIDRQGQQVARIVEERA